MKKFNEFTTDNITVGISEQYNLKNSMKKLKQMLNNDSPSGKKSIDKKLYHKQENYRTPTQLRKQIFVQCQSNPQPDLIRNLNKYKSLVIQNNNQIPDTYQNEKSPLLKATDIENSFHLNLENQHAVESL